MGLRSFVQAIATAIVLLPLLAVTASADPASGDEIMAAIGGNTVLGSMEGSGAYSEFYDANGTIVGPDYTGNWSIEGDTMCFQYGEDPADCWMVEINGSDVNWIKDGAVLGTGTIAIGNQLP